MSKLEKQRLLLKAIFRSCGGPTELQHVTHIPRQNFTNWQIRGRVPLLLAVDIAEKVGISKWGLNYFEFCKVVGEESPSWEEVVNSYFLPKGVIAKLLKGEDECQKKTKKSKKKKKPKKRQEE